MLLSGLRIKKTASPYSPAQIIQWLKNHVTTLNLEISSVSQVIWQKQTQKTFFSVWFRLVTSLSDAARGKPLVREAGITANAVGIGHVIALWSLLSFRGRFAVLRDTIAMALPHCSRGGDSCHGGWERIEAMISITHGIRRDTGLRLVVERKGATCSGQNPLFMGMLRGLGYSRPLMTGSPTWSMLDLTHTALRLSGQHRNGYNPHRMMGKERWLTRVQPLSPEQAKAQKPLTPDVTKAQEVLAGPETVLSVSKRMIDISWGNESHVGGTWMTLGNVGSTKWWASKDWTTPVSEAEVNAARDWDPIEPEELGK
ncbi:hypothetical protein C8J56DRAFT_894867 [Mycena floridula]|nr:hypothetical protein C8J56DRAFT_894867 [Mycena floridula]